MAENAQLTALAQSFRHLKDRKEVLETELKEVNGLIEDVQVNQLPKMMDENNVEKFTVAGVGTIYQQVKVYAYVKKEDQAGFYDWLRENGHGDLIKAIVFSPTLSSFAKEQIEAGNDLPEMLVAHKVPTAMLRRK